MFRRWKEQVAKRPGLMLVATAIGGAALVGAGVWIFVGAKHVLHKHPGEFPSTPEVRAQIRQQVIAAIPPDAMFNTHPDSGGSGKLKGGGVTAQGTIQPYRLSHVNAIQHLAFLARIRVDREYHGLAPSPSASQPVWNYWVAVLVRTNNGTRMVSAYVAPDVPDHVSLRYLTSSKAHEKGHKTALARFKSSETDSWGTCSNMCCCEDNHCKHY